MTPQHDRNPQPQVHANDADLDDTEDTYIIMSAPEPTRLHEFMRRRAGDVANAWHTENQERAAKRRTYHLPFLPHGPSQMQRRWHLAPDADEHVTGVLHVATRVGPVAMPQRYQLATHPAAHPEQAYTLSLAAQMLAQESPISEQGPPTNRAGPPWTNDASGTAIAPIN